MRRPPLDVAGRVVLVTGGARGIGLDTARRLAARGARLALLDIDGAEAQSAASFVGKSFSFFLWLSTRMNASLPNRIGAWKARGISKSTTGLP